MDKKIVIFDLDGTLLNTLDDLTDSTNYSLKFLNYPQRTKEEIKNFVGNGVVKLIERAIPNGINNPDINKCIEIFKQNYSENMYNKTSPYPGIIELLKNLKSKGYKIAVVSNKFDNAVKDLCDRYFENLIDFCAGENETLGIRKKPAPDAVIKILNKYDIKNSEAVYVGDSEVDILTAKNSKIPCISVSWGFKNREFLNANGAKIIIDNPIELLEALNNI
ncbi:HAD-IA family hydrolase [bacterium]|nr:HAD-IA family hydrolase [bacterium]